MALQRPLDLQRHMVLQRPMALQRHMALKRPMALPTEAHGLCGLISYLANTKGHNELDVFLDYF